MASGQTSWQDLSSGNAAFGGIILHGNVVDVVIKLALIVGRACRRSGHNSQMAWLSSRDPLGSCCRSFRRRLEILARAGGSFVTLRLLRQEKTTIWANPGSPSSGHGSLEVTPQDFLSVVSRLMRQPGPDRVAFVLTGHTSCLDKPMQQAKPKEDGC